MYLPWSTLLVLGSALALPRQRRTARTSLGAVPEGWTRVGRPRSTEMLTITIGLRRGAIREVVSSLQQTSNPSSPRYGQHLSYEHTQRLLSPSLDTSNTFDQWLRESGAHAHVSGWSSAGDSVKLCAPIETLERLLNTTFHVYSNDEAGASAVRAPTFRVPVPLAAHVETIQPTTMFPRISVTTVDIEQDQEEVRRQSSADAFCGSSTSLSCIMALYGVNRYIDEDTTGAPGSHYGVVGFSGDNSNIADFQKYMGATVGNLAAHSYFYPIEVNGGNNSQVPYKATIRANLAMQWSGSLTYPIYARYYVNGGIAADATAHDWAEWMEWALGEQLLAPTILIPYADPEHLIPEDVAKRVCDGFAVLASRGHSIIVPAGDEGVRSNCSADAEDRYTPYFPASCPYVTAVGGVTSESSDEYAVKFSGSGFSNYFERADFQSERVINYLADHRIDTSRFNANGRAYPDVTARATDYDVVLRGRQTKLSSTVASATTFASIIVLVNDALIELGKPQLGFLNPQLYGQLSHSFKDIQSGSNGGCANGDGFNATVGYDVVTGLGTPNYAKMLQALGI